MKRMDKEGAMSWKGTLIVGLALVVVALLIAIPLANSSLITGNEIIFEGKYEISDKVIVAETTEQERKYPMTNGENVVFLQPENPVMVYNNSLRYYNIEDQTIHTIWEHPDNGLQLTYHYDMNGDRVVFMVEDTVLGGDFQYYLYDFTTEELAFLFNTSISNCNWFGVKIYENYVLWGVRDSNLDKLFVYDIRTDNSHEVMEIDSDMGNYVALQRMDIWENQVVVEILNTTYDATLLARANILNPHIGEIKWVINPEGYYQCAISDPLIYGSTIACMFIPQFGAGKVALIENFTSVEPTLRIIEPDDEMHKGYIQPPFIYDNFVLWYKYNTAYDGGWIYLHDISLNKTWRIDTSEHEWLSEAGQPAPHMQGNVICWGERIGFSEWYVYYMTIGTYSKEVIAPKFVQSINLNGIYLLGITATVLVGLVATEWIAEGGLPSIGRPRGKYQHVDIHRKEPPDYREL